MARVLVLTPQMPYPPQQGTSLRNYHILRALALSHEVTLLSFADTEPSAIAPLHEIARVLPPVPVSGRDTVQRLRALLTSRRPDLAWRLHSTDFAAALDDALRSQPFDVVQIEGIELAWVIERVRASAPAARIVLDCHNAETELQRRAFDRDRLRPARWPAAGYSAAQIGRLAHFERWALQAADAVVAVSEEDRRFLAALLERPDEAITIVPNMIDVAEYRTNRPAPPEVQFDVVFTGKMDYRPNVDGVLWFAEAIWPLIRRRRPATTWAVVGQKPHARLTALRELAGVTVTGRVPEVQPYLTGASVTILPLRIGSGTRLKLIEAMAAGCAIVSTRLGAEGFAVTDGRELLLADTAEAIAAAVLDLLDHPQRRAELSGRAVAFAAQYDWRRQAPLLDAVYARLVGGQGN